MPKLPAVRPKEILKVLQKYGFDIDHVSGSHYIMYNPGSKKRAVVPMHNKELQPGTLHSIIKGAGLEREDFLR